MVTIFVNDSPKEVAESTTVTALLQELGLQKPYLAVSINETIVPRRQHATTLLTQNDRILIVQAVGGG